MKALFSTLSVAVFLSISIPSIADGDCPSTINVRWVGPSCDTIAVSLIFNVPCNGKCPDNQTASHCQFTSSPTTMISESHDGSLTIPCCATDIQVKVSGCGHSLQIPYQHNSTGSANGMVILIDDEGNMRVNGKANPKSLASSNQ